MPASLVRRAITSVRDLGMRRSLETAGNLASDLWFDASNRVDTNKRVWQNELEVDSDNQEEGAPYFPMRGRAFRKALEAFHIPRDGTLVDLGSGKGKILLLAAQMGFPRVHGVEFSPELSRIADANVERMRRKLGGAEVKTICIDAAAYEFSADENVFFMFAPFGPTVMRQTMANLQKSLDEHPRPIWVVSALPNLPSDHPLGAGLDLVTSSLAVTTAGTFVQGGHEFTLLRN